MTGSFGVPFRAIGSNHIFLTDAWLPISAKRRSYLYLLFNPPRSAWLLIDATKQHCPCTRYCNVPLLSTTIKNRMVYRTPTSPRSGLLFKDRDSLLDVWGGVGDTESPHMFVETVDWPSALSLGMQSCTLEEDDAGSTSLPRSIDTLLRLESKSLSSLLLLPSPVDA